MPVEFKLPDLGEGIHEGEIIEVLVHAGDRVEDGQTVLIVETDKATAEVPSPVTGTVKEIRVKSGQTVRVGEVLMVFTKEGEGEEKAKAPPPRKRRRRPKPRPGKLRKPASKRGGKGPRQAHRRAGSRRAFHPPPGARAWYRYQPGKAERSRWTGYPRGRASIRRRRQSPRAREGASRSRREEAARARRGGSSPPIRPDWARSSESRSVRCGAPLQNISLLRGRKFLTSRTPT